MFQPGALDEAASIIRHGGLVAFPTETVYGLGADACNPEAVARVFEAKRRPAFDPIIVHIASASDGHRYGDFDSRTADLLMDRFWPGPLTLVVRKKEIVPSIVTAGLPTVGLRVPANVSARELIRRAGCALAAPSANPFGYVSPTEASHVASQLSREVSLILDGGKCPIGVESTILSIAGGTPRLLRSGGTPIEELESILGSIETQTDPVLTPQAPGQLARHYATKTPLQLLTGNGGELAPASGERVGLLALGAPDVAKGFAHVEVLSRSRDLREAATNLFSALRRLDAAGLDRVVAERVPETGLGRTIMDRLRRCAAGH